MKEFGEILENVSLKNYNTYKIGGIAKYLIKPYNVECLIELIKYLKKNNIKYFILGGGSNVILPDEDYDGCVILLSNIDEINIDSNKVSVLCGINLNRFINILIDNELGGLENLFGIPGSLAGAIHGNAGSNGSTVSDYLDSVTYLENDEIIIINKSECNFSLRNSIFKYDNNKIIISATFNLSKKDKNIMKEIIKNNQQKRMQTQPLNYPNAGSVFKNPDGFYAGKLIEDAGLMNYHINDAYISDKHANFIINKGNATSKDIIDLTNYIKSKIKEVYNVDLILEQEIIKY